MSKNLKSMQAIYPNLSSITGHRVSCFTDLDVAYPAIKYFTFLRNPVERFISHFHYSHCGKMDDCIVENLEKFTADAKNRNVQTKWICGQEDSQKAIDTLMTKIEFVGLTEKFDESLLLLRSWLNNRQFTINYQSRRVCKGESRLPYYTDPYLIDLIQSANEHDIELYKCAANELFPKQRSAYGEHFTQNLNAFLKEQETFKDFSEPLWGKTKRDLIYKPSLHLPWS